MPCFYYIYWTRDRGILEAYYGHEFNGTVVWEMSEVFEYNRYYMCTLPSIAWENISKRGKILVRVGKN